MDSKIRTYIHARTKGLQEAYPNTWITKSGNADMTTTRVNPANTTQISESWFAKLGRGGNEGESEEATTGNTHAEEELARVTRGKEPEAKIQVKLRQKTEEQRARKRARKERNRTNRMPEFEDSDTEGGLNNKTQERESDPGEEVFGDNCEATVGEATNEIFNKCACVHKPCTENAVGRRRKRHAPLRPAMPLFPNGLGDEDSDSGEEDDVENVKGKAVGEYLASANKTESELRSYPAIIDPGAVGSALPEGWCPQAAAIHAPQPGKSYSAASGPIIKNKGATAVSMVTKEGRCHDMTFQVCGVTRPLASVYKICEKGQPAASNPPWGNRGSFTQSARGDRTYMTPSGGVSVFETKVAPTCMQTRPSFGRQGVQW